MDPKVVENELVHIKEKCTKMDTKLDGIAASVHVLELKAAELKGGVRAYAAVVATIVALAVSIIAKMI